MPGWARAIVAVGLLRTGTALSLYLSAPPPPHGNIPLWTYAGLAIVFTSFGLVLVVGNRQDDRAAWLGGLFVLISSVLVTALVDARAGSIVPALIYTRPEALTGAFLWQFLARFPSRVAGRAGRLLRAAAYVATLIGAWCLAANLAAALRAPAAGPRWWSAFLGSRVNPDSIYWLVVFGVAASALPALAWRARTADADDRPRIRLFVGGLLAGLGPFAVEVFAEELWPAYKTFAHAPAVEPRIGAVLFGALAIAPAVTAYSVLYDRIVEVRVVLRAAAQYALARYTVVGATLLPFAALVLFLFDHRQETLAAVFAGGPRPLLLIAAALFGLAALRLRTRWLAALDRRYFRDAYDARQALVGFLAGLPDVTAEDVAARVREEIDRTLHADVEVFLADDARVALRHVGDRFPPVALGATLVQLVVGDTGPMDVALEHASSPLRRLSAAERRWLEGGRFMLLVGVRRGSGGAAGLIALRAKRSGLTYSPDDRRLLAAVASAAGLALDSLRLRSTPEPAAEPPGRECLECSRLNAADALRCGCGGEVVAAAVPHILRGTFRIEERIGAGGMGVVYRAIDLNLGRDVAIKALPRATPQHVARLRREARAMAVISHPNLAVIHGVETWRDTVFIVQEYVAGGTFARRLASRPATLDEVLDLGITVAGFLEHLHRSGVVHCDIKPSNIGFTERGLVKVLDFGLARILRDLRADSDGSTTTPNAAAPAAVYADSTGTAFGTPHFMSPEAIRGERPSPAFDLWALAVVLYEALAGRHPFGGGDILAIHASIAAGPPADIRRYRPDVPEALSTFLASALAYERIARPADAGTFVAHLRRLRGDLQLR